MPGLDDWHSHFGHDGHEVSGSYDLGFYPGGSKQQVRDDAFFLFSRNHEPNGGQPSNVCLLHDGPDRDFSIAART